VSEGKEDWTTLQQRLNNEIDAVAKSDTWPPLDKPAPPAMVSTGFPLKDIREGKSELPPPSAPGAEGVAPGSLLERLKQQAAEKLASEATKTGLHEQQKNVISKVLQETYVYLRDLTKQLNVVKPEYPASYFISEQVNLNGLTWKEGQADYRLFPGVTEDRLVQRVTMHYELIGKEPVIVEREYPGLELLNRSLNEYGLSFETLEFKNERGRTQRSRFTIKREVRAGLLFMANYEAGDIRLRTFNVQRLGSAEYNISVETLNPATVEEIALLVLGTSNQFVRRFRRVA
jgi:hypothetical protein